MKTETVLSSAVLPRIMRELRKSMKVSAVDALWESWVNGRRVTCVPKLTPLSATPTGFVDGLGIGVGLVVLLGAPWSGAGDFVIVGGGSAEKAWREAYVLLKCIYILFFIFSLALQCFPILVTSIHASFFLDPHTVISFSRNHFPNPLTHSRLDSRQMSPKMYGVV